MSAPNIGLFFTARQLGLPLGRTQDLHRIAEEKVVTAQLKETVCFINLFNYSIMYNFL